MKIVITVAQTDGWIKAAKAIKEGGEALPQIALAIAEASDIDQGPPSQCDKEELEARTALREKLVKLTIKAGYAEETAGPMVSRVLRTCELALREKRVAEATRFKPSEMACIAFRDIASNVATHLPDSFWDDVSKLCALYGKGEVDVDKRKLTLKNGKKPVVIMLASGKQPGNVIAMPEQEEPAAVAVNG